MLEIYQYHLAAFSWVVTSDLSFTMHPAIDCSYFYLIFAIGSSLHWQNKYLHFLYSYQHEPKNLWQNNLIFTNIIQYLHIFYIHNEYFIHSFHGFTLLLEEFLWHTLSRCRRYLRTVKNHVEFSDVYCRVLNYIIPMTCSKLNRKIKIWFTQRLPLFDGACRPELIIAITSAEDSPFAAGPIKPSSHNRLLNMSRHLFKPHQGKQRRCVVIYFLLSEWGSLGALTTSDAAPVPFPPVTLVPCVTERALSWHDAKSTGPRRESPSPFIHSQTFYIWKERK